MRLSGEMVTLREMREEDLKMIVEYLNDPEIILNLEDDTPLPSSIEKEKETFGEMVKNKDIHKGFHYAIVTKDGTFIGGCGANHVDQKNKRASVGIFIGHRDYLGKGYGTEAMKLLVDFLFREVNLHKVKLNVFAFNKRAIRSYEKCGFKVEVVSRDGLYRDGQYHDIYVMSLMADDYFKENPPGKYEYLIKN